MSKSDSGKGDIPRPRFISDAEWDLRYDLAMGHITKADYDKKIAELHPHTRRWSHLQQDYIRRQNVLRYPLQ